MRSLTKMGTSRSRPQSVGAILARLIGKDERWGEWHAPPPAGPDVGERHAHAPDDAARYDFDLAEFPLFRLHTRAPGRNGREPLVYEDTITGRDGEPVRREWRAYPGPFGFGGPSTQRLLFELLQLYADQGQRGGVIRFGSLRSLLMRGGERNPSSRDYERARRDIDILRGYDFQCKNAFWDRERRAYVDMHWRLFGAVYYLKRAAGDCQPDSGFIEVSPVLGRIARDRGFFALGFDRALYRTLRPLEQRLAVYLAKKFVSQSVHRRFVDDLARALPIEATRRSDVRAILADAGEGLLRNGLPILRAARMLESRHGRWVAEYERNGRGPARPPRPDRSASSRLAGGDVEEQVERIIVVTGKPRDRAWWARCVRRLGPHAVDRGLGQLKEACQIARVRNPAALLTKIFKDIALEAGVDLR
jgi:hypothetical protein